MDAITLFAQSRHNLEALQSFHALYSFKKILEQEFGHKITFDQLGEIVDLILSKPSLEEMQTRLPVILRGD